jgi:CYTH domain-containing protein
VSLSLPAAPDTPWAEGWEIERKFLVETLPEEAACYSPSSIRQGYVAVDASGSSVRVRQIGDRFFLTIKQGQGLTRREVEMALSADQFETLWPLTEGRRIEKQRYALPYESHTIELDVYAGALKGLLTAEVEFASIEAATGFVPPSWFGLDVTDDLRYTNQSLSIHGVPL